MASLLVGEHDFTTFTAEGDANVSKVRIVTVSSFHAESDMLVYTIAANSFLWKMVRTIVGTFLDVEERGGGAAELAACCSRATTGGRVDGARPRAVSRKGDV